MLNPSLETSSDWMGALANESGGFRILVHLRPSPDGPLEGTLDNLDVGCIGMPICAIACDSSTLRFDVEPIETSFDGRIGPDGRTLEGTWHTQDGSAPLTLHRVQPSDIDGTWTGELSFQNIKLRLVFYFATGPDGPIAALKSRDQGGVMVPLTAVNRVGSALVMEAAALRAGFEGTLNPELTAIDGTWTQGPAKIPLLLSRTTEDLDAAPVRPQEPSEPYPYREVDVRYANVRAGLKLAGTLTLPDGPGPFHAVLLISGSGQHDRNGTMFGHQPFLVLADYLTRRGVAVLRTDDRGVVESEGDFVQSTTSDFATDAEAAIDYLRSSPEIDSGRISIIGHSEGALIAAMVAARDRELAGIVILAGPGLPGWILAGQQARRQAELYGASGEEAEKFNLDLVAILRGNYDLATLRQKLDQRLQKVPDAQRAKMVDYLCLPWQRHFVGLNPADYLQLVQCRVLALVGDKDISVEPKSNLDAIRQALETGGNQNFEAVELPGLNHLFQNCETGAASEYGRIDETFAPSVLERIAAWINLSTAGTGGGA